MFLKVAKKKTDWAIFDSLTGKAYKFRIYVPSKESGEDMVKFLTTVYPDKFQKA